MHVNAADAAAAAEAAAGTAADTAAAGTAADTAAASAAAAAAADNILQKRERKKQNLCGNAGGVGLLECYCPTSEPLL